MAKYEQYAEYKDSEVEWLGEIPKNWKILTFKWLANEGKAFASGPFGSNIGSQYYRDEGVPVIRGNNLNLDAKKPKFIDSGYVYLDEKKADELSNAEVISGDLVFTARGTVGQIGLVPDHTQILWKRAILSANQLRFRNFNNSTDSNYLWYLFSSWFVRTQIYLNSDSVAQPNLNLGSLKNLKLIIPEYFEQTQIANFLDHETAQIDTLIDKQQTLIQLLKEKRQAVISHAVTKGLNPDAPMKDSDVEWLGEVPEHWEVSKLKYLISEPLQYGANEAAEDVDKTQPRFVRITDVLPNGNLKDDTFRSLPQDIAEPYMLMDGDVLLARSGGTVGKSFIYRDSWGKCCFAGYLIKAKIDENITPAEWFYLNTLTDFYWKWIESIQIQATIQNVSADKYNSFVIAVPPLEESYKIISHIKFNLEVFDTLVMKAEQAIQLMQERRTALISAAVTGKIDVRGWRVPE